jgi:hypothetical protein
MIDLTGKKYGKLTVLEFMGKKKRHYMWRCKCDCGNECIVSSDNLNSGNTKSCGCLRKDKIIDMIGKRFGYLTVIKKHHSSNCVYWLCRCDCGKETVVSGASLRNGHTRSCGCGNGRTKEEREKIYHFYHVWWNVLQRCKNKNAISYPNYGGRGIKICKRWEDYLLFKEDMFEGYSVGLQIDRIDNNGDYCKENCKWVTSKENATHLDASDYDRGAACRGKHLSAEHKKKLSEALKVLSVFVLTEIVFVESPIISILEPAAIVKTLSFKSLT